MSEHAPKRRGPMGGHGPMGGMHMAGEKAKDFKGSFKKLLKYLGKYRVAIVIVMIFAIASAAFMVLGPKILGKAITEMMNGLIAKVTGVEGGGINFGRIGEILLFMLGLYVLSAAFSFIQGFIMTGVSQKVAYNMRRELSEKIGRLPMKYFDSRHPWRGALSGDQRRRHPVPEPEPKPDPDHHCRHHHHRRADHDADHQLADDSHYLYHPADFPWASSGSS